MIVLTVALGYTGALAELDPMSEAGAHLKVLSFDRGLAERAGESITIGIMFKSGSAESERSAAAMVEAFEVLGIREGARVHGKRVVAVAVAIDKSVAKTIAEDKVDVVYLAPVPAAERTFAIESASALGLPTLCGRRSYVARGIAVGVVAERGTARILLNLDAARRDGMRLSSRLTKLAELVQ